jgi:hypothetical protein
MVHHKSRNHQGHIVDLYGFALKMIPHYSRFSQGDRAEIPANTSQMAETGTDLSESLTIHVSVRDGSRNFCEYRSKAEAFS